ncbi:Tfp pilus assembly protein FimT/FimU [Pseudomonas sp. JG-B]|uniref:pilus assembly FimT family protein n=2 Tax=unclassified Pseudomonas TaxID=196821 RepID=UPI00129E32E9|nr:GspH/FimT family pseudopilin [Pseudomonas sp. JG-B]MDH4654335.1 prepilin-type N-terminal cleavage/methylation domain-containing protein [Pseudomonas sp. BN606]MRK23628.1 prepilin-type N-terminal cleavage/methylation domain-containing protein [Pseudomonas sp. JG-B]
MSGKAGAGSFVARALARSSSHRSVGEGQGMSQRGFTLIELLVTLAVLVVLIGLAAPNLSQLLLNSRASAELSAFSDMLNYARREAVQGAQTIRVSGPLAADGAWQVLRERDSQELRRFAPLSLFAVEPEGLQSVLFDSQGRLLSASRVSLDLAVKDSSLDCAAFNRTISIELSGSISQQKGDCQ